MVRKYFVTPSLRDFKELVERAAREYRSTVAFKDLDPAGGGHEYTFIQVKNDVAALGTALLDAGLGGRHCALMAESSYAYVVTYLAIATTGGVVVPLDKELTSDDLAKLIRKSDSVSVFYGDAFHEEMPGILAHCPDVTTAINISRYAKAAHHPGFDTLLERGRELLAQGDTRYAEVTLDPTVMSAILFTSGTTGANKGVQLSQRNVLSMLQSVMMLYKLPRVSYSVLPINHSYEFNMHVLGALYDGLTVCFNDSILHVQENLKRYRPEMSLMVPMIVEQIYKNIWKEAERNNLAGHLRYAVWLSDLLRKVGVDLRSVFFKPVHKQFGGNLRLIVSGGAPLRPEIEKGLDSLGFRVFNGYGITECSPFISANSTLVSVPGSVGTVPPGIEVRIGDAGPDGQGEIQVRGANVMLGYYRDPDATARTFTADGWFKTGDLGHFGQKGALFITGRQKNTIVLDNGKNVQPEELEEILSAHIAYVDEVMVHEHHDEEGRGRIAASAWLNPEWVVSVGAEQARVRYEADVAKVNQKLASYKRIHLALVRDHEFEKTTTRKIKRNLAEGASA